MSNNIHTFEVKVEVKESGSRHFSPHVGMYIENKVTKMFHFDTRTPKQAERRGEKHGRVISVQKVDVDRMRGNMDSLMLRLKATNPYPDAVAMDEMIWRRKDKRAERLENREKDKNGH